MTKLGMLAQEIAAIDRRKAAREVGKKKDEERRREVEREIKAEMTTEMIGSLKVQSRWVSIKSGANEEIALIVECGSDGFSEVISRIGLAALALSSWVRDMEMGGKHSADHLVSVERFDASRTVFTKEIIAPVLNEGVSKAQIVSALKDDGFGAIVAEAYNANTFAKLIRELPRDDADEPILPDALKEIIGIETIVRIQTRKGD